VRLSAEIIISAGAEAVDEAKAATPTPPGKGEVMVDLPASEEH